MGITKNKLYFKTNLNLFEYITIQSLWGSKKNKFNCVLNSHALGIRNGFAIFRSNVLVEYLNRCSILCYNVILNKGDIAFLLPSKFNDSTIFNDKIKKLIVFFSLRSLQPFYLNKRINSLLITNYNKKPCIVIIPSIIQERFFLKEFIANFIPFIHIESGNFDYDKGSYSILGNNTSLDYVFFCYKFISYFIIRSTLLIFFKDKLF